MKFRRAGGALGLTLVLLVAFLGFRWWQGSSTETPGSDERTAGANGTTASSRQSATSGGSVSGGPGGRRGASSVPVRAETVSEAVINDRLEAIGTGRALASATVVPLSAGVLTDVPVSSGQRVQVGDLLATLDTDGEVIARDRASRAVEDAREDLARMESLYRSRTSTQVEVSNARTALANAELSLRDAELQLERRRIVAPIEGVIGIVPVEKGNYVTTQTDIVTIDDRSDILVEFWVPERFAGLLEIGQNLTASSFALPGREFPGEVAAIGSRVEADSRTLPVRARLDNEDDRLRPGMSFTVRLQFDGERYPAVDPLAVQWDSLGSYVWRIEGGVAAREAIRIVQRNPESVLVEGELTIGDLVVTEGVLNLREGSQVRVIGGGSDAPESPQDREGGRQRQGGDS